jgi:hypothetical protein
MIVLLFLLFVRKHFIRISRLWPCIELRSLWIKPINAPSFNFIVITTLHVSGSLSAHHQEFLAYIGIVKTYAVLVVDCYQARDGTGTQTRTVLIPIKLQLLASVWFYSHGIHVSCVLHLPFLCSCQIADSNITFWFNQNTFYRSNWCKLLKICRNFETI